MFHSLKPKRARRNQFLSPLFFPTLGLLNTFLAAFPMLAFLHTVLTVPELPPAFTPLHIYIPKPHIPTPSPEDAADELDQLLRTPLSQKLQQQKPTTLPYIIYRALGNDLPPRHAVGQTRANLAFILEHEPKHQGLERRWYLNRIVKAEEELEVVKLLLAHQEPFVRDALDLQEYGKIDYNLPAGDLLHSANFSLLNRVERGAYLSDLVNDKNQYVMHNNQARNNMLKLGIEAGARYVLPFDGNCFLNKAAWRGIRADIEDVERSDLENVTNLYFAVNMTRMTSNEPLLNPAFVPETALEEPQLIFHRSAVARFDEGMRYGRRPKVELLWRLGVPGAWDDWIPNYGPWGTGQKRVVVDLPTGVKVTRAGWTARLFSGVAELELGGASKKRGKSRIEGVERLLAETSRRRLKQDGFDENTLMWYDESRLRNNRERWMRREDSDLNSLVEELIVLADRELNNDAVYAVTMKGRTAPGSDVRSYLSAAPYYWPNNMTVDGIPYVRRDGERAPGTVLHEEGSEKYDRTRWADFSRNMTVLTLASYFEQDARYSEKAAQQVRTWFLDEQTKMNPHLRYAQMQFQRHGEEGSKSGLIDFANLPVVLDAIRMLYKMGALSEQDMKGLREWIEEYGRFLKVAKTAQQEFLSHNNHGTLFDVQAAAVFAFVGDFTQLLRHTSLARLRLRTQFDERGAMPAELARPAQLHYMMYGLQAWVWLARMSERLGIDVWGFEGVLERGVRYAVPYFSRLRWRHPQVEEEDMERMVFLYHCVQKVGGKALWRGGEEGVPLLGEVFEAKAVFDDYSLVPVFWNLGV